ncbi:Aim21p KNAG_0E03520 [Huiozyma naganishii CBS 8797]|uniref:Altered inheritance of mitochondria protein 21 n=1 Tax=Huiozyma naganishii (strain ATCC MYA-139 / BCRC 22969 / CBS 8797 / KCTC 17520 / NBRC 10181 / NCYC 3082 / Yp74L-3) TaxID=1071383 RepID=J7S6V7_HUIN7|nr:hypothetical protein KNAG_0E03520 [Kazachstania naganishii CBS 8797]CCK70609.1 hypothetical protein KNAG_0E03520 [Kazachstania naganishii CBS 8797]
MSDSGSSEEVNQSALNSTVPKVPSKRPLAKSQTLSETSGGSNTESPTPGLPLQRPVRRSTTEQLEELVDNTEEELQEMKQFIEKHRSPLKPHRDSGTADSNAEPKSQENKGTFSESSAGDIGAPVPKIPERPSRRATTDSFDSRASSTICDVAGEKSAKSDVADSTPILQSFVAPDNREPSGTSEPSIPKRPARRPIKTENSQSGAQEVPHSRDKNSPEPPSVPKRPSSTEGERSSQEEGKTEDLVVRDDQHVGEYEAPELNAPYDDKVQTTVKGSTVKLDEEQPFEKQPEQNEPSEETLNAASKQQTATEEPSASKSEIGQDTEETSGQSTKDIETVKNEVTAISDEEDELQQIPETNDHLAGNSVEDISFESGAREAATVSPSTKVQEEMITESLNEVTAQSKDTFGQETSDSKEDVGGNDDQANTNASLLNNGKSTEEEDHEPEAEVKPSIPATRPKKRAPPPVPKKPSSKIAAFHNMLQMQQQKDLASALPELVHKAPKFYPVHDPTGEDNRESDNEDRATNEEDKQDNSSFGGSRAQFTKNLNGLIGLPGMAPQKGIPPALNRMLATSNPSASEATVDVEKVQEGGLSDVRQKRARGPRGRKLPTKVNSVTKVTDESGQHTIEIFEAWSMVSGSGTKLEKDSSTKETEDADMVTAEQSGKFQHSDAFSESEDLASGGSNELQTSTIPAEIGEPTPEPKTSNPVIQRLAESNLINESSSSLSDSITSRDQSGGIMAKEQQMEEDMEREMERQMLEEDRAYSEEAAKNAVAQFEDGSLLEE